MKRLLAASAALIMSVFCLCAEEQPSERRMLEDSVIVGGISRPLTAMVLENEGVTEDNMLVALFVHAEYLKSISREHLAVFTDEELREILRYQKSDACRYMLSSAFIKDMIMNISKAMTAELGGGGEFSYVLNDKEYGAELDETLNALESALKGVIDGRFDERLLAERLKAQGVDESMLPTVLAPVRKVLGNIGNIIKVTLMDYVPKESLREVAAFDASETGRKYRVYNTKINQMADVKDADFASGFMKKLDTGASETISAMTDYVTLSRSFPDYMPVLYRPYAELKLGKSLYAGQTRDLKPHGQGMLTDKKGVVYTGDFRNGKRHGLIQVSSPGKPVVRQIWVDDRYHKELTADKNADGSIPDVLQHEGNKFGYGSFYDYGPRTTYEGVFIDDLLCGLGKVSSPEKILEGEFADGEMVTGIIRWIGPEWRLNEFRGRVSGDLMHGVRKQISADGMKKNTLRGGFVNGYLDGEGTQTYVDENQTVSMEGVFAYGKLYGEGVRKEVRLYGENGILDSLVYEGGFFANQYHGEGSLRVNITNIPTDRRWTFTRGGIRLHDVQTDSLSIVMEGRFELDNFVEGKLMLSDGSWFEGRFNETGLVEGMMCRQYSDGSSYLGECRDGKIWGQGKIRYADGSVYEGLFENGVPADRKRKVSRQSDVGGSGQGQMNPRAYGEEEKTVRYTDLPVEKGKVRLVSPFGVKILVRNVSELEVTCKGTFDGEVLRKGKVTMSDGNWMEGTFEDGVLISGRARNIDKYGTIYEGDIKNGYSHGNGKCIYRDGTSFKGRFANGNRMGGTHYSADGKVIKVYK